ncbi:MATE family Na+-driven efflux transporter [Endozoicomonas lisbonensis]|uniref:Na+-driven multidrug efflux pump n=1 Tax=Endozoicomonas lisbonensis TaxID=3120522 RepID=A0ABV2SD63_9GAMM
MFSFQKIDYRLFFVLLLSNFIPVIYSTVRVYFLGSLPDTWGYSIAAQAAWLNLIYEVISEGLLFSLYFILGQVISQPKAFSERLSVALRVVVATFALFSVNILLFAEPIVLFMGQGGEQLTATVSYIRLESLALLLSSVYAVAMVVLVLQKREQLMYLLLALKTVLIVILDSLFVSQLPVSLQLGVNGVAWTNIVVNGVLVLASIMWLSRSGISIRAIPAYGQLNWVKNWMKISAKSGLESLVRNLAFMLMILKLVNEVQQAGVYWVTNQFIWGWLLLPVLALGNLIKQDAACCNGEIGSRFKGYCQLTALIALGWVLTMPAWEWFIRSVMGAPQAKQVAQLAFVLVVFYIVFAFNNILDSYFYGIGRTDLLLYQSLVVSGVYYSGAYILYSLGYFVPTLDSIAVLFGMGIVLDAAVTGFIFWYLVKHRRLGSIMFEHSRGGAL